MQDNSTNLLQYLVSQFISKYDVYAGTERAQLPLPEPSAVSQAAAVNFDDLHRDLDKLHSTLEGFDLTTVKLYNNTSVAVLTVFCPGQPV